MTAELRRELASNMPQIRTLLKKSPATAFTTINEIASRVGSKYGLTLSLNFPQRGKIDDFEAYGTENLGMVFSRNSRRFPIPRDIIKSKASEILENPQVADAYMYEGKEGVRVTAGQTRLDILPSSLHIWGKFDPKTSKFCDWLLENCYRQGTSVG